MTHTLPQIGGKSVAVSEELTRLVARAFELHGRSVQIPPEVLKSSCEDLASRTTEDILEIRRRERTVSPQTLGLRFA